MDRLLTAEDIAEAFDKTLVSDRVISITRPPQGVLSFIEALAADYVIYECSCAPEVKFEVTPYGDNITEVEDDTGKIVMKACCPRCSTTLTVAEVTMRASLEVPTSTMKAFEELIAGSADTE